MKKIVLSPNMMKNHKFSAYLAIMFSVIFLLDISLAWSQDDEESPRTRPGSSLFGDLRFTPFLQRSSKDPDYLARLRLGLELQAGASFMAQGRLSYAKVFDSEFAADDDRFQVDRLFLQWSPLPFEFAAGRLPTMEAGAPSHLRLGLDQPPGALAPFTDLVLDGISLGFNYNKPWPGRIRLYYATQFEYGYESGESFFGTDDTRIGGFGWDLYRKGDRSFYLQSFGFFNIYNLPEDVIFPNPLEFSMWLNDGFEYDPQDPNANLLLDRTDLGDIYHTTITYQDRHDKLDWFLSLGWSHTDAKGIDELGNGLLSGFWSDSGNEDGYSIYAGLRLDLEQAGKIGLEYNHGSRYWVSFSQDPESGKLTTRGSAAEAYWSYALALPPGPAEFVRQFLFRLGYQHYWYEYTGSGFWLGTPIDIDDLSDSPLQSYFYEPIDNAYLIYCSFDLYF